MITNCFTDGSFGYSFEFCKFFCSNPFLCKFKVKYHDWGFKAIIIDCCELWKFTISIDDDYINISTRRGRGFGQYDLEQVIEILDYKEDIIDMLFKED